MHLAEQLGAGVEALRRGDAARAVGLLEHVVNDAELAAADDLVDVRARACSLYAQALLGAGRPDDAAVWVREAMRALRRIGDGEGMRAVRGLQDEVTAACLEVRQRQRERVRSDTLASQAPSELLRGVDDPVEQAQRLVQKSDADRDHGRHNDAERLAREALRLATGAGDLRTEVFARIAISRAVPASAHEQLNLAFARSEQASEFNLVSAVHRAAQLLGVSLPTLHGPELPGEPRR